MIRYDAAFYKMHSYNSSSSAAQVVPYLVSQFRPQSVVDVGCGIGTWAAEFRRQGVPVVIGIDGAYVDKSQLRIPESSFLSRDLERPLASLETFDLAISVEVAEHLSPSRASSFVEDLIRLAPVVVFSAAVPFQGGKNHVNEQWSSYWHSLFAAKGFRSIDCLRARFWNDPSVAVWYRQNMMVYASEDRAQQFASLGQAMPVDVVHPELFQNKMIQPPLKVILKGLPGAFKRALELRCGRPFDSVIRNFRTTAKTASRGAAD
jgi:SAM-dependent methyltransferase